MEFKSEASVEVTKAEGSWTVRVVKDGAANEQSFDGQEAAEDFAASQRLLLGIVPQQDMA